MHDEVVKAQEKGLDKILHPTILEKDSVSLLLLGSEYRRVRYIHTCLLQTLRERAQEESYKAEKELIALFQTYHRLLLYNCQVCGLEFSVAGAIFASMT